ncbi:MAG: LytTR family DNA-binding domain-containing protein [Lachnospiraceae bacterium]|nr:LytTR family DNA-binding domain-containing protein [Lachnospiraceae bacterium]
MITIAICDDNRYERKEVANYLLDYSVKNSLEYTAAEYESGEDLINAGIRYDLIFMDYQFKHGECNGIETSKKLREQGDDAAIVFLSAYSEVVFDTFEVNAYAFLVKPLEKKKFGLVLDRYINERVKGCMLILHEVGMNRYVNKHDIICIEASGKKCTIHLADKKRDFECNRTLSSIEIMLNDSRFYRCQKSYLINLDHVSGYNSTEITMDDGTIVMMGRKKYKDFLEQYGKSILKG